MSRCPSALLAPLFLAAAFALGPVSAGPTTAPTAAPSTGVEIITRAQWGSKPQPLPEASRQTPKLITLHHAGTLWKPADEPYAKIRGLQAYGQKEKNWPDLPYHYLISPDGRVFEGRDWHYRPESNTKYDLDGVMNIHLWGNFEEQRVSPEQLRATVALVAQLCRDLKLDPATIRGHKDAAPGQTSCPGKDFHRYIASGQIRTWVEQTLAGQTPEITPLPEAAGGPTTQISTTPPPPTSRPG